MLKLLIMQVEICLYVLFLFKVITSTPVSDQETIDGASFEVPVTHPEVQKYAKLSLEKYSQDLKNKSYEPIIHSIVSATEQIVAGTIYRMKIKFGESTCTKGQKINCAVKENGESEYYNVEVYSIPWEDNDVPKVTLTRL